MTGWQAVACTLGGLFTTAGLLVLFAPRQAARLTDLISNHLDPQDPS